ncbi:hypothetical protein GTP41_20855 [Pseudoduganella sp. DS3]|uniref:Uncharacterized protein n=1 Tax=Pseudoduganella guangdongensis TaxID=2692179 RepID=A0A6N9HMC9_9BURK|nr:hypothetical protein [Pseudoduganella guangdongensis]MYN04546.1 hypothetical protein [Pseudoduganella guangdongensis]
MKEQEEKSVEKPDFEMMFPGWSFIRRHLFEIVALAIPLIGIVGFAAGTSFLEGWSKAAGIGSNLFPVGVNETILLGLKLTRPWAYSGGLLAVIVAYFYLTEVITEWERAKWGRETHWQRWQRIKLARAASSARKLGEIHDRLTDPSNSAWRSLGPRRRWGRKEPTVSLRAKRWRRFGMRTIGLVLFLFAIALTLFFHFLLKVFIIEEAHVEGVRRYGQLYVAITGKLPLNFYDKLSQAQLQQFACAGNELLWHYRSVELSVGNGASVAKQQAYIIHSTDKLFFLLDKDGSRLHSFGDEPYSLRESSNRPVSAWIKTCVQSS